MRLLFTILTACSDDKKSSRSNGSNAEWVHPADTNDFISCPDKSASAAVVAVNANGDSIIVWEQETDDFEQVFKSEKR